MSSIEIQSDLDAGVTEINTSFFATYDVRGIVNDQFGLPQYAGLAVAFARWLKTQLPASVTEPWVAVGYDARIHSPQFCKIVVNQLLASGVSVLELGLVPSPLVYFAECYSQEQETLPDVAASLVVTASHNPGEYNGLKFTCSGQSISSKQLKDIRDIYQSVMQTSKFVALSKNPLNLPPVYLQAAQTRFWDVIAAYRLWCKAQFGEMLTRPKVVIDCGNGAGGVLVPLLLEDAGCTVVSLFEEPDGHFPNHHPDPCAHDNLKHLIEATQLHQADLGVAFDGDADRLGVVDNKGRIIPGDMLLLLFAKDLLQKSWEKPPAIVSEVKCSMHLFSEIEAAGGRAVMNPTGHAFIKERMLKEQAVLGGELSGHFFFRDRHWGFDDAPYAMMRLVQILEQAREASPGCQLEQLTNRLPKSFLSEEKRIYLDRALRDGALERLLTQVNQLSSFCGNPVRSVSTIDGIRVNFDKGFWLVRLSNTEPCFTLRVESSDAETLKIMEDELVLMLDEVIKAEPSDGSQAKQTVVLYSEKRPWGFFDVLSEAEHYKLKSLSVNPGSRLSLQLHEYREEHWLVVKGSPEVTVADKTWTASVGEYIFIPKQTKHRLANYSQCLAEVIEIQMGEHFSEQDIVRFQDDYDRV